jgi:hypothetical protein
LARSTEESGQESWLPRRKRTPKSQRDRIISPILIKVVE